MNSMGSNHMPKLLAVDETLERRIMVDDVTHCEDDNGVNELTAGDGNAGINWVKPNHLIEKN